MSTPWPIAFGLLILGVLASCSGSRGPHLAGLTVAPASTTIALGESQPLSATGVNPDGSTVDLTSLVTWSATSNVVFANRNQPGRATAIALGTTTVTASYRGLEASAEITVVGPALSSIAVTPPAPTIAAGSSTSLQATGTYTDLTTRDLTSLVTWTSETPAVAVVSQVPGTAGRATGVAAGSSTITATLDGVSGSVALTVTAAFLTSLDVTPTNPSIALGTSQQFTATGTFSDLSVQDLTDQATWSSTDATTATVSNSVGTEGLASSVSSGTSTITASHGGLSGTSVLTVTPAVLVSLAVTPTTPSVALGLTQQLTATGTFSDATVQDLTDSVTWTSSATGVATVSNAPGNEGLVSSVAIGTTTVTATLGAISDNTLVTVSSAVLTSLAVSPSAPSIALGLTQQFAATGTYSDSSMVDVTTTATWTSSTPATATISNAGGSEGLATSAAAGSTTITATIGAIDDDATLTVTAATLTSIAITPSSPTASVGGTTQLTATGTYSDASVQDLTALATWTSSAPAVATISNAGGTEGLATGVSLGTTTITASYSGVDDTEDLEVKTITHRASASAAADNSITALAVSTPSGTVAGDVMIAAVSVRPRTATITPPAGWTLVTSISSTTGNTSLLSIYSRTATVSEPASHTWNFSTSTGSAAGISTFCGVDTTSPIDVHAAQTTPSSLTHTTPAVTTTVANTMVMSFHGFTSSATWTPPTGMTEAWDVSSLAPPASAGIAMCAAYELQAVAGTTGTRSATASNDADTGNTVILALAPK